MVGPSIARQVTRHITQARTWRELATITNECGGASALNDIHIAAALSRLAKMYPNAAFQQLNPSQYQHQERQPSHSGKGSGGHGPSLPFGPVPPGAPLAGFGRGVHPFPAVGAMPLAASRVGPPQPPHAPASSSPGGRFGPLPRSLPVKNVGQPPAWSAMAPELSPGLTAAAAAHDGTRSECDSAMPCPATSAEELCVELLEALARRSGLMPTGTVTLAAAEVAGEYATSPGTRRRRAGTAGGDGDAGLMEGNGLSAVATPLRPPPARVLANATWGAARLLTESWPRQQGTAPWSVMGPPEGGVYRQARSAGLRAAPAHPLQHRARAALGALLSLVPDVAPSLEPQHVSNLLYTVAQLAERMPEALEAGGGGGVVNGSHSSSSTAGSHGPAPAASVGPVAAGVAGSDVAVPSKEAVTRRLVTALLDASQSKLPSFGPQALSNSLYSVTLMGISPPQPWLRAWMEAAEAQLLWADPQHIANMLWALARLGYDPGESWVLAALQAAALKAPAFTTQGLCNSLWALARLGFTVDDNRKARALLPLLEGLGSAARECGGQDVANGMWALARLHMLLPPPRRGSANALHGADSPQQPTAATVVTGCASPLPPRPEAAVREALQAAGRLLLQASSRHLQRYSPQQLANTSWAAAVLGLQPPPDWTAQFWPAAQAALCTMRTDELVATSMACARLQLQPPGHWLAALLELTSYAMQKQEDFATATLLGEEAGCGGANGGSPLHLQPQPQPQPQPGVQTQMRFQATGRALAGLLWCLESWQVRVPVRWTAAALGRLETLAAERALEPAALATALQAMARMRLRPDAVVTGWTVRVVTAVVTTAVEPGGPAASDRVAGGAAEAAAVERLAAAGSTLRPGGGGDSVVGGLDGQCSRMLLWSLARLRCPVSGDVAGVLALKAAGCGSVPAPTAPAVAGAIDGGAAVAVLAAALNAEEAAVPPRTPRRGLFTAAAAPDPSFSISGGVVDEGLGKGAAGGAEDAGELGGMGAGGARNVCVSLWGLACLSIRPGVDVMRHLARRATEDVPWATESELLSILRSFAALGFRPGARFRAAAEVRIVALGASLERDQAAALLSCCARLQWRLSREALEAVVMKLDRV